jgi:murein L,D-transpeptidase YcbB/YkuD
MNKLIGGAATALVAGVLGSMTVTTSPAAAAYPECRGTTRWDNVMGNKQAWFPTTYNGTFNVNCTLSIGSRGPEVTVLQTVLNRCYSWKYGEIDVDGRYGSETANQVEKIQRHEGVDDDGVYGPGTRRSMVWMFWHDLRHDEYRGRHAHCIDQQP